MYVFTEISVAYLHCPTIICIVEVDLCPSTEILTHKIGSVKIPM